MCTFVTRIIPPSGQVNSGSSPPSPKPTLLLGFPGEKDQAVSPWGESNSGRGGEEEKDKEKLNRFFSFSHREPNAATEWENKASLQIPLFVLQIPTFPTDRRPDEPLNAE